MIKLDDLNAAREAAQAALAGFFASQDNSTSDPAKSEVITSAGLLAEIRDLVQELVASNNGQRLFTQDGPFDPTRPVPPREKTPPDGDPEKKPAKSKRTTLRDAIRPVTDAAKRTRLGGITSRLTQRVRKPIKEMFGKTANPKDMFSKIKDMYGKTANLKEKPSKDMYGKIKDRYGKTANPKLPAGAANAGGRAAGRAAAGAAGGAGGAGAGVGAGGAGAAGGAAGASAGAAGAGGAAAGAAAAGGPLLLIVGTALALNEVQKAGRELAYEQEAFARTLAEVNPRLQAAIAELDAERTFRQVDMGEATANTSERLLGAIDRWEKSTQVFEQAGENLKNIIGSEILTILSEMAETTSGVLETVQAILALNPFYQEKPKPEEPPALFGQFVTRIYDEENRKNQQARERARNSAQQRQ